MAGSGRRWDQRSDQAQAYRRLYKTAKWKHVRAKQLEASPLCVMCKDQGRITPATVCDHVDPKTKANPATFYLGPFQSLCKTHHDSSKQKQERRGHEIGCDASGMPLDPRHHWNNG